MTTTLAPTAGIQTAPEPRTPGWLIRSVRRLEQAPLLDRPADLLTRLSDRPLRSPRWAGALRGDRFGHALHPVLTDFPLGAFMSASLLDLIGGERSRPAATGLVGFGLTMSIPTIATGLAEWRATRSEARRVGVVHAATNLTATSLYAASLVARVRARHGKATALGVAGGMAAWVGGYLGGHLSLVRKIGTADPSFGPPG